MIRGSRMTWQFSEDGRSVSKKRSVLTERVCESLRRPEILRQQFSEGGH